ncbi:methylated-DNA--[protein]-cysteine S-methyltransferase [Sphingobacterium mizutaii]|uniref:methylated-DNA--[protein]-cysteine S-methyltransferase n=1 Tax=Sphingobacterium mizutaii TaxID=1010 RepID=UPI003D97E06A
MLQIQLEEYFLGQHLDFLIPMVISGTDFLMKVWREIRRIKYGQSLKLRQIAYKLDKPNVMNSISYAYNKNRLKILIPRYRINRMGNHNTALEGGLWRMQWLQDFEKRNLQS